MLLLLLARCRARLEIDYLRKPADARIPKVLVNARCDTPGESRNIATFPNAKIHGMVETRRRRASSTFECSAKRFVISCGRNVVENKQLNIGRFIISRKKPDDLDWLDCLQQVNIRGGGR